MVGERIAHGWTSKVKERLGGKASCTHLMEMLIPLATAAYQTLTSTRLKRPESVDANGRPRKIDSCYAYASDREIVHRLWPMHYDGPQAPPTVGED